MESLEEKNHLPLALVVSDCVKRWFQETLKEAKAGDTDMQVLLGQMYNSGYGVPSDPRKGHAWISRASKSRTSVWKVCTNVQIITQVIPIQMKQREELNKFKLIPTHGFEF